MQTTFYYIFNFLNSSALFDFCNGGLKLINYKFGSLHLR